MIKEQTSAASLSSGVMPKGKILVVDDDQTFRLLTKGILNRNGYGVIEASNGLEGLHMLRSETPDLVLCDINMPILTGIEFVEEASSEYPSLPMIVVSGTEKMSIVAKALKFGIKDFITKPISDPNTLVSAVNDTLEQTSDEAVESRDFASQWFQIGTDGEVPEEQELHWHLAHLQQNPEMARELLTALVPDSKTSQGSWECNFGLLQSLNDKPVIYDYLWLMNGQFVFYIVDTQSGGDESPATTLLIRALFNDYIRNRNGQLDNIRNLVGLIEKGIHCSDYAASINALFGVIDLPNQTVSILPAGIEAHWRNNKGNQIAAASSQLGDGVQKNRRMDQFELLIDESNVNLNQLRVASIPSTNFHLNIQLRES